MVHRSIQGRNLMVRIDGEEYGKELNPVCSGSEMMEGSIVSCVWEAYEGLMIREDDDDGGSNIET
jgi:hypothetical protein